MREIDPKEITGVSRLDKNTLPIDLSSQSIYYDNLGKFLKVGTIERAQGYQARKYEYTITFDEDLPKAFNKQWLKPDEKLFVKD